MKKPVRKYHNMPAYDLSEVLAWIIYRTGRDPRDWAGRWSVENPRKGVQPPYQDFWHVLTNIHDFNNPSYFWLSLAPDDYKEDFAQEIIKIIAKEFGDDCGGEEMYCYVEW